MSLTLATNPPSNSTRTNPHGSGAGSGMPASIPRARVTPPALDDPDRYIRLEAVPILDDHWRTVERDGVAVREHVDRDQLEVLARNSQYRADSGELGLVFVGHTDPKEKESSQPPRVGYMRNYRVGTYERPDGTESPCILADLYIDSEYRDVIPQYPRRSVEVYRKTLPTGFIADVALLKRLPERGLGMVTYQSDDSNELAPPLGGRNEQSEDLNLNSSINFSELETFMCPACASGHGHGEHMSSMNNLNMPPGSGGDYPGNGNGNDGGSDGEAGAVSPEQLTQALTSALNMVLPGIVTGVVAGVKNLFDGFAEEQAEKEAEEEEAEEEAAMAGEGPPGAAGEAPEQSDAGGGGPAGAAAGSPPSGTNEPPSPDSSSSNEDDEEHMSSALKQEFETYQAQAETKFSGMQDRITQLELINSGLVTANRNIGRLATLNDLKAKGFEIDPAEEVERFSSLDDAAFGVEVGRIEKNYARSPVNQPDVMIGTRPDGPVGAKTTVVNEKDCDRYCRENGMTNHSSIEDRTRLVQEYFEAKKANKA